ncbi:hypothetical protein OPIT5_20805 [Opitutaceae bacterium TAV5]|nr:hypothetical protein OPIT5_20805 [Opitutaceae bacterium TAV5]
MNRLTKIQAMYSDENGNPPSSLAIAIAVLLLAICVILVLTS